MLTKKIPGGVPLPGIFLSFLIAVPTLLFASDSDSNALERLARKGFDTKIIGAFLRSDAPGILTAFLAKPAIRVSDLQMSFRLRRNDTLGAEYLIMNRTAEAIDISLLSFVDYRRVGFRLADRHSMVHRLHLKPGEWMTWPYLLEGVDQGAHDFLILGVVSDLKGRSSSDFSHPLLFHRANIFVEGGLLPTIRCHVVSDVRATGGAVEEKTTGPEIMFVDQASVTDERSLRVRLDNSYDIPISLMTLLISRDDKLPHIGLDLKARSPCFTMAPRSTYGPILKLPAGWTGDDVLVILVENPFTRLEPKAGTVARVPTSVRTLHRALTGRN